MDATPFAYDFFLSRRGSVATVAQEVAGVLTAENYRVRVQDYDFAAGGQFVRDIDDALKQARDLLILYSADYHGSFWTRQEFHNFLAAVAAADGTRRIGLLRCDDDNPSGLLASATYGDLHNVADPVERRRIILAVARGEAPAARAVPRIFGGATMPLENKLFTGREAELGTPLIRDFEFDAFLSHSSRDKATVQAIAERLRSDGLRIWLDSWEIRPGDNIPAKIDYGLENSRVLVLCMSIHAFGSEWTHLETHTFRFRDPLNKERRFVPIRLDDAHPPGSLAQFLHIDFSQQGDEECYAKLCQACRSSASSNPIHPGTVQSRTTRDHALEAGIFDSLSTSGEGTKRNTDEAFVQSRLRFLHDNREMIEKDLLIQYQRMLLDSIMKQRQS